MDYRKLDEDSVFHQREARLQVANDLGFDYITQALAELYKEGKSFREIGRLFGQTAAATGVRLKRIGAKIRPRGGANNIWNYGNNCIQCGDETIPNDGRANGRCKKCANAYYRKEREKK